MVTVAQLEALFIGNEHFDQIEKSLDIFCPFEAVGMIGQEIRHAHFLRYCLDPRRPHGFGSECLSALMRAAAAAKREQNTEKTDGDITPLSVHLMDFDAAEVRREWRRIDLVVVIEDEKLVVPIELKIDAAEHSGQLRRYRNIIEDEWPKNEGWKHLFIFMTKNGDDVSVDGDGWLLLPMTTLAHELDTVLRKQSGSEQAQSLLGAYLAMLRRHHLSDENLENLAEKLWNQHREALDFLMERQPGSGLGIASSIFEERGDIAERLSQILGLKVIGDDSTARLMRFAVEDWDSLPDFRTSAGWTSSQRILLLEVATSAGRGSMSVRFVLGPAPAPVREQYYAALEQAGVDTSRRKTITGRYTRLATRMLAADTIEVADERKAIDDVISKLEQYAVQIIRPYHDALNALPQSG